MSMEVSRAIVLRREDREGVFRQLYERLARVYRRVVSRLDSRFEIEIETIVERTLVETIDDWMGSGEDTARAERVLTRSPAAAPRHGLETQPDRMRPQHHAR